MAEKSYTTGRLGASPGSVTQDPAPKDLTLHLFFLRILWASMLLFMLLIQTTATLSVEDDIMMATWNSRLMGVGLESLKGRSQGEVSLGQVLQTNLVSKNRLSPIPGGRGIFD